MKETLLDVLLYLFENYEDADTQPIANRDTLRVELTAAGFPDAEVEHAFAWLARLAEPRTPARAPAALRIFAPVEIERLDAECRGLLMDLERIGVLDLDSRELVIDLLMSVEVPIDARLVKWACLLVVLNRETPAEVLEHEEFADYTLELRALVEGRQSLQ